MAIRIREPFNAVSHFIGAVLTVVGLAYLIWVARLDARALAGFTIYGVLTTLLFAASAAYHWSNRGQKWLQRFDHAAIYFMIAGTYTPVCLLGLQGNMASGVLIAEWAMAAIGVIATFTMAKTPTWLRLVLYLGMGWMALPLIGVLLPRVSAAGIGWIVAGGLAYTLGTIVYAAKRPNPWPGKFGSHEIWHLFVLGGGVCHYLLMVTLAHRLH